MNYLELRKLSGLYFSRLDFAGIFNLTPESSSVTINRYIKKGYIIRLKSNYYILREKWAALAAEEKFIIANIMQVPSYISLTTALAYYGLSTQVQQDYFESICVYSSETRQVEKSFFRYTKVNSKFYSGYVKKDGFFIAVPEKALADALYLTVRGKYRLDISSVDRNKLDNKMIDKLLKKYPPKISKGMMNLWKI